MMLSHAASLMQGELTGEDASFGSVSKDSRSIAKNDLYFALRGERFDGHEFVEQVEQAGAVAAVVSEPVPVEIRQIRVADTRLALGKLAAGWRDEFNGKMIGITGSNGKTTVKEMCCCILRAFADKASVLSTTGNLNNDIGMPMTILSLQPEHRYAVIEMGANHSGEIAYLTNIARPNVAVITNAGPAHLEGFGSVENVSKAKAEIYSGLSDEGVAVINLDDQYSAYWRELCRHRRTLLFSMKDESADVYAACFKDNEQPGFTLSTPSGSAELELKLPGRHNVMNALAATAATFALGVPLDCIVKALSQFEGVSGRLMIKQASTGARVLDDTYNANPSSLNAGIEVLMSMEGEAWLVLGDMGELGDEGERLHEEVGRQAKQLGVERLFAIGEQSAFAVRAFGEGAQIYADQAALIKDLKQASDVSKVILVKGSRFMGMEKVVEALVNQSSVIKQEVN